MSEVTHQTQITVTIPLVPQSHWPTALGTDLVPSPADAKAIRQIISQVELGIDQINVDVKRLENTLGQLAERHARLQECAEQHKALVAPIRGLPSELLADIFEICTSERVGSLWKNFPDPQEEDSPLILAQVCRRWRSIAITTARLWSVINTTWDRSLNDSSFSRTKTWLERSGEIPLTIQLRLPRTFAEKNAFGKLIAVIAPSTNRWDNIMISFGSFATAIGSVGQLLRDAAPRLRHLHLHGQRLIARDNAYVDATFEHAPFLYSLYTTYLYPQQLTLPWSQLRNFWGEYLSLNDCVYVLQKCKKLTSCRFDWTLADPLSFTPQTELYLPNLHTLSLTFNVSGDFRHLLDCLTLPSLRTVHLSSEVLLDHDVELEFSRLISRSSCPLESLEWGIGTTISMPNLQQCLAQTPSLVELSVLRDVDTVFYTSLTSQEENTLCPRLQTLSLRSPSSHIHLEYFLALINSRYNSADETLAFPGVAKLRKVRLFEGLVFHNALQSIHGLRQRGLDIQRKRLRELEGGRLVNATPYPQI